MAPRGGLPQSSRKLTHCGEHGSPAYSAAHLARSAAAQARNGSPTRFSSAPRRCPPAAPRPPPGLGAHAAPALTGSASMTSRQGGSLRSYGASGSNSTRTTSPARRSAAQVRRDRQTWSPWGGEDHDPPSGGWHAMTIAGTPSGAGTPLTTRYSTRPARRNVPSSTGPVLQDVSEVPGWAVAIWKTRPPRSRVI
jgi:hypothetical protein